MAAWTLAEWKRAGLRGWAPTALTACGRWSTATPWRIHLCLYPELRDRHARNAADNFLGELIGHAHRCGVKVHLMLTADGHARDFCRAHPEAARLDAEGKPGPQHGLALEHPLARRYILDVLDEVLELYPEADGVAVHPTESDPDRFNPESLAAYRADTGRDLRAEAAEVRRAWHNRTFARFMGEMAARCRRHNPDLDVVMANCWWQDGHVAINRAELPPGVRIAVWHYEWEAPAPTDWPIHRWTQAFGPERRIYLPDQPVLPLFPRKPPGSWTAISAPIAWSAPRGHQAFATRFILPAGAFRRRRGGFCDALLARRPTASLPGFKGDLIPELYKDYFSARGVAWELSPPGNHAT